MSYWLQIVHTSLKYHHGWKGVVFDAHLLKTVAYKRHTRVFVINTHRLIKPYQAKKRFFTISTFSQFKEWHKNIFPK